MMVSPRLLFWLTKWALGIRRIARPLCLALLAVALSWTSYHGAADCRDGDQRPSLSVPYLQIADETVILGDATLIAAVIANTGTAPAHNVIVGATATTQEFETIARDPYTPIAVLVTCPHSLYYA